MPLINGKFVDKKTLGLGQPAAQTQMEDTTMGAPNDGSDTYSKMQKLMLMLSLKDPKNASKYATILNIAKPATPTAAELKRQDDKKTAKNEKDNKLAKIDRAMMLLKKKSLNTGPLTGPILAFKTKFGLASPDETELYALIGEIGAQKMFEIGGKVLPAQEIDRLKPFVPLIDVDKKLNLQNLETFKSDLTGVYDKYGAGDTIYGEGEEVETSGGLDMPNSWMDEEEEE